MLPQKILCPSNRRLTSWSPWNRTQTSSGMSHRCMSRFWWMMSTSRRHLGACLATSPPLMLLEFCDSRSFGDHLLEVWPMAVDNFDITSFSFVGFDENSHRASVSQQRCSMDEESATRLHWPTAQRPCASRDTAHLTSSSRQVRYCICKHDSSNMNEFILAKTSSWTSSSASRLPTLDFPAHTVWTQSDRFKYSCDTSRPTSLLTYNT